MKTRFKTLDEFYKAIDVLIRMMTEQKHPEEAKKLHVLHIRGQVSN
jgi:hypothetical protein